MRPDKPEGRRVLVLGGTTEASALVRGLAGQGSALDVTLSLAGRTVRPKPQPVRMRIGGFGGVDGLARWMIEHGIDRVVDATHPFAAQISRNAAEACDRTGTPLLAVRRPPWKAVDGDCWTEVATVEAAVAALGAAPRRVLVTIGRQELGAFAQAPQHRYHVRSIEPVDDILSLPHLTAIAWRGPYAEADELALMQEAGIEVLVTKNSGGSGTYAKIAAARTLGLPVVIVRQPDKPDVAAVADADGALAWLLQKSAGA